MNISATLNCTQNFR